MRPTLIAEVPLGATFYAEEYATDCTVEVFYGMRALRLAHNGNLVMTGAWPRFTLTTDYEGGAAE